MKKSTKRLPGYRELLRTSHHLVEVAEGCGTDYLRLVADVIYQLRATGRTSAEDLKVINDTLDSKLKLRRSK